jgi:alkylation response protein AidB-like acyl-CoA dehydrogenase
VPTNNKDEIFSRVRTLTVELKARSAEIETARRIPMDVVEKLREAGGFRISVPSEFGGAELEIIDRMNLLSLLAEADASAAWTVAIASNFPIILACGARETFQEVFGASPDVVCAGAAAPTGSAELVEGGYKISGRWSWMSGSLHAVWLLVTCVVTQNGKPMSASGNGDTGASAAGGPPLTRTMVIPADQAEVIDMWRVAGLCGTGSNDLVVKDVFVPEARSLDYMGSSFLPSPHYRSFTGQAGLILAAIAIGIARGAINDLIALSKSRKQRALASSRMIESEMLQNRIGRSQIVVEALNQALHQKCAELMAGADGIPAGVAQAAHPLVLGCGATAAWIAEECAKLVDVAYNAGGGSSVWLTSSLQRRFRDMHVLTSHAFLSEAHATRYGQLLLQD